MASHEDSRQLSNLRFWVLVVAYAAGIAVGAGKVQVLALSSARPICVGAAVVVLAAAIVIAISPQCRRAIKRKIATKYPTPASGDIVGPTKPASSHNKANTRGRFTVPQPLWVYAFLITVFLVAGVLAGAASSAVRSSESASSTTQVQLIPQNGSVSQGVYRQRGQPVWQTALTQARLTVSARQSIKQALTAHLNKDQAGLMLGIIMGDTAMIAPETKADFRTTGLSHILAVSGMNVTILIAAVGLALGYLVRQLGTSISIQRASRLLVFTLSAATITGYMILCGLQPSIMRAGLTGLFALIAVAASRRTNPQAALAAVAFILLAIDPASLFDLGFQLSFGATISILLLARPLASRLAMDPDNPGKFVSLLSVAGAAQLGVWPLLAINFNQVSLVTLAANVLVEPAVAPAQVLGMLLPMINAIAPALANVVSLPASLTLTHISGAARWLAMLPFASISIPLAPALAVTAYYAALLTVYFFMRSHPPRPSVASVFPGRRLARIVAAGLLIAPIIVAAFGYQALQGRPPQGLRVTFIDVGQGDCALIQAPDGATILVDGGPQADSAEPALRARGVTRVNLLIVSHQHSDHTNGLAAVTRDYTIDRALVPPKESGALPNAWSRALEYLATRGAGTTTAAEGEKISVGKYLTVEILSPDPGESGMDDPNGGAVVARVTYKHVKILFAGDIDAAAEEDLVADNQANPVDIFKVPHHGSKTGADTQFLDSIQPKLSIISVGAGNPYHHPAPTTLAALRRIGSRVFRTDKNGSVTIESDGTKIFASAQND